MNKVSKMTALAVLGAGLAIGLGGCTPGNNTPGATVAGAGIGAVAGAALFDGSPLGIIAGGLIGGVIGNSVGQNMDRQDRANMQSAIINTQVGSESTWTNQNTNTTYTVRPVRNYHANGNYCREYQTKVLVNGKQRRAYGKACRMPDGSWKIVK